jgi:hypothetical protein
MKHIDQFEIKDINIDHNSVEVILRIWGKEVYISWKWEWENGIINGLINGINEYLWEKVIDIDDMKIINKPCLPEMFRRFQKDVSHTSVKLSESFCNKIQEIIPFSEESEGRSKQIWVAHVALKVNGGVIWGVCGAQNVDRAVLEAIIEWSLKKIVDKTLSK